MAQIGGIGDGPGCFSRPKGVAVDTFGHVYVIDALFDNVQVFDQQTRFLLNWGEAGPGTVRAVTESDVCVYCHTPHQASSQTPLWNRALSVATYIAVSF